MKQKRKDEKKKKKADIGTNAANPIDETLINGFRPYLFDGKYVIDQPLPTPSKLIPYPPSITLRYLIPGASVAIFAALSALFFTLIDVVGFIFLILTIVSVAFAIPSLLPAQQLTPQSTLDSYLKAKSGRCYGKALSILAVEPDAKDNEIDLHALWAPENKWPEALLNRLKQSSVPELRNVTGSDNQNTHLFIHADENTYWLLPMIRINNKWYITNPEMKLHSIKNEH